MGWPAGRPGNEMSRLSRTELPRRAARRRRANRLRHWLTPAPWRFFGRLQETARLWIKTQGLRILLELEDAWVIKKGNHMPPAKKRTRRKKLTGLSEIFNYLRKNTKPIYIVTPTPYSLLGLDQWVGGLEFINYFDIFDGSHPRAFVPTKIMHDEFQSMEDVGNYLVSHPQFVAKAKANPDGKAIFVMFNETTEQLCADAGIEVALAPAALRERLDSKIVTTQLGNEAGVDSAPNIMGEADSYEALMDLAKKGKLGSDLVVQTPYGDSGRTTFFIKSRKDWDKYSAKIIDQKLKVMKRLNHLPGAIEGCATRLGTFVGPVMTDITGFAEVTPYKGGWCGNDASPALLPEGVPDKVREMARKFGDSEALDAALDWCQEHDFLNDRRFAGFFVRSRIERGQGPLRIRSELQQRGLPEALVKEALEQAECDWFALARETHARRFRRPPADRKEKARQLRFLQSRGFDAEQSFNALDLAGEEDLD